LTLAASKLRKLPILTIGILLFIVILNSLLGWFRYPLLNVSPFEAVPQTTAIIFETNNYTLPVAPLQKMEPFKDLKIVQQLERDKALLTDLLGDSIIENKKINALITLQNIGVAKTDLLYVFDLANTNLDFQKILKKRKGKIIRKYRYQGYDYQSIKSSEGSAITFFKFRNLLLVSKYSVLVEDGIRQLCDYQSNIRQIADFRKIYKPIKDNHQSRVYVNFAQLPKFFRSYLKNEKRLVLDALPNFASWLAMDLDPLSLGTIEGRYIKPHTTRKGKDTQALQNLGLLKVIPDNTGFLFMQEGIDIEKRQDSVYQEYIKPWILDEWALSLINPRTSSDRILILEAKDREYAHHYLEKYGNQEGILLSTDYQTFPMIQLVGNELINPFLNHLKLDLPRPYYTIIENYVLFSKSRQSLEVLIGLSISLNRSGIVPKMLTRFWFRTINITYFY